MSVVRIAREKQPKLQHRPFTEREKELNKMTIKDMRKEWRMKFDPYKLKGMRKLPDGKDNPFYFMSLYRIQNLIKTWEKSENPPFKEENENIETAIEFIITFKDLLRCSTSEAVGVYLIFKHKLESYVERHRREPSDKEYADMAYEAIQQFRSDWEKAMQGLERLWRK